MITPTSFLKWLYYLMMGLLFLSSLVLIYYIWIDPNLFQLDMGGQIASASFLREVGIGNYNMYRYMGMINNLFYPWLQDIIVNIIQIFTQQSFLISFQVYVTLVVVVYILGFLLISTRFVSLKTRILYLFFILCYLHLQKPMLTYMQGLGYIDIGFTGLISEILGGVWLNFLLYEFLGKQRSIWLLIRACLAFFSHLVVGPIAFALLGLAWLVFRKKKYLYICLLGIIITAVFWLPFLMSKSYITTSSIIGDYEWILLAILGGLFLMLLSGDKKYLICCLLGLAVFMPMSIFYWLGNDLTLFHKIFPHFHYARFMTVGLQMIILAFCGYMDQESEKSPTVTRGSLGTWILMMFFCMFVLTSKFDFITVPEIWNTMIGKSHTRKIHLEAVSHITDEKRIFVVDTKRPVDFNLDSYFQYQGYKNLHFVKGLFWESSRSNNYLTSFLGTLLRGSDLVVNNTTVPIENCEQYGAMFDYFVQDYAIGRLLTADIDKITYLDEFKKQCYDQLLARGTSQFDYIRKGNISLHGISYGLYQLIKKQESPMSNEFVQIIHHPEFQALDMKQQDFYFSKLIYNRLQKINSGDITSETLFYVQQDYPNKEYLKTMQQMVPDVIQASVDSISLGKNSISFHVKSETPVGVWIKWNYFPGWKAFDDSGHEISLYPLYNGIYIKGTGNITLYYKRMSIFYYALLISIFGIFGAYYILKKIKYD